jgi:hypothetical protein
VDTLLTSTVRARLHPCNSLPGNFHKCCPPFQSREAGRIGEEHGALLALPFQSTAGGEDFVGQMFECEVSGVRS